MTDSTDNISIKIVDNVDEVVVTKIIKIADAAEKSHNAIELLKKSLDSISSSSAINTLTSQIDKNAMSALKAVTAEERLSTAQSRSATAALQTATAQQKLETATNNAATSALRQETAQQRLTIAENQATSSALRLENAQNRAARSSSSFTGALTSLKASLITYFGLNELKQYADEYTRATGLVNIFSHSQAETNVVMQELFDIAQRTRQGLEGTVKSYHQLTIAGAQLGATQNQMLAVTELVGKAFAIQGTPTNTAKAGILQLSHAMTEGIVRGRQFNSLMIEMPRVLQVVADHIDGAGGSVAKLRKMMLDGKLTSKDFFEAAVKGSKDLDTQFDKTGKTISQGFTYFRNALVQYIGQANQASGASSALFSIIKLLADNIGTIVKLMLVAASGALAYAAANLILSASFAGVGASLVALSAFIATNPFLILAVGITVVITALALFASNLKVSQNSLMTWGDLAVETIKAVGRFFGFFSKDAKTQMAEAETGVNSLGDTILTFARYAIEALNGVLNRFSEIKQGIQLTAVSVGYTVSSLGASDAEKARNKDVAQDTINDILNQGIKEKDALSKAAVEIKKAAENRARARIEADANAKLDTLTSSNTPLGKAQDFAHDKDKQKVDDSATALVKLNAQLNSQLKNMFLISDARKLQEAQDKIEIQYGTKKLDLNGNLVETAKKITPFIRNQIELAKEHTAAVMKQQEVQKEFDSVIAGSSYEAQKKYNNEIEGAKKAFDLQIITSQEYSAALTKANEAKANFFDPLRTQNKALDDQVALFGLTGDELQIATKYQQIYNEQLASGRNLHSEVFKSLNDEAEALAKRSIQVKYASDVDSAYRAIVDKRTDAQRALNVQLEATQRLQPSENKTSALREIKVSQSNLNLESGQGGLPDILISGAGKMVEGYKNAAQSISEIMGTMFQKLGDGFAENISTWIVKGGSLKDMFRSLAGSIEQEVLSSLIKVGERIILNSIIEQTAITTTTAAKVASDATVTGSSLASMAVTEAASIASAVAQFAAWLPAALTASVGSFGSAAIIGGAALATAFVAAKALKGGFKTGGYTGDIGVDQVAGVVHGKEFVFDAAATQRIGVDNLESIRKGTAAVNSNMPQQVVNNNTTNTTSGQETHVINVLDPSLLHNYMVSAQGKKVIYNVIKEHEMVSQ